MIERTPDELAAELARRNALLRNRPITVARPAPALARGLGARGSGMIRGTAGRRARPGEARRGEWGLPCKAR